MGYPNLAPSQFSAVVGVIDPDAYAAGTYTTGWIDAKKFTSYQAIVMAGTLGSSATVDAKLEKATNGSGSGAVDVTGKAIVQLTQAGTDSDKQAIIELRPAQLGSTFTHFRLSMTIGTATSDAGAIVLGRFPLNGPASASDLASVDEIVA
jgi:hypothetical protein